jgi:hypothetical protein
MKSQRPIRFTLNVYHFCILDPGVDFDFMSPTFGAISFSPTLKPLQK